jgi:predicted metal-dependent hydrolase
METAMEKAPDFEVRNLKFQLDATIPRHWFAGSPSRTAFFDSLSPFFVVGERFFVKSVKRQLPKLKDPELLKQARQFCGQEGIHQREHETYNRMLDERGYPATHMEAWVRRLLWFVALTTYPRIRLAVTCALEHFTAIGANRILSDPRAFEGADPRMRAFWRWHAAEETEHKGVPFDVYEAVGGFWLERVAVMLATTFTFQAYAFFHMLRFMWIDGGLFSARAWRDLGRMLAYTNASRDFFRDYLAYYRPGFHPWQLDNRHLITEFETELATSPYYAGAR